MKTAARLLDCWTMRQSLTVDLLPFWKKDVYAVINNSSSEPSSPWLQNVPLAALPRVISFSDSCHRRVQMISAVASKKLSSVTLRAFLRLSLSLLYLEKADSNESSLNISICICPSLPINPHKGVEGVNPLSVWSILIHPIREQN